MRKVVIGSVLALCVAACSDQAGMTPLNAQAQAMGSPHMDYTAGLPGGIMRIVFPDGEKMPGRYAISEQTAKDNFTATASDSRTSLRCVGTMIAGHGTAQCTEATGAQYEMKL